MRTPLRFAASLLMLVGVFFFNHSNASAIDPAPSDEGIEVQGRGPIHEAFAQPVEGKPVPGAVIAKEPPKPVPELPPEQKPKGDHVEWIPGYWAWDADKTDYIWVSGLWRNMPPGRRWVPGHWAKVEGGWQWTAGEFLAATQTDVKYVDAPPDSLAYGPTAPQPYADTLYVPGNWVPRGPSFAWRPGFWTQGYDDYVWTPAHYCYTPSGYIYVDGYWDYPLANRGLLFAPVWFNRPYWLYPGWYYRPRFFVGVDGLFGSLWFWPHHHHYFFGDFYGSRYWGLGFRPWYSFGASHFDPLFSYYGWRNRGNPGWASGLHNSFQARSNGTVPLPVRSFSARSNVTSINNS